MNGRSLPLVIVLLATYGAASVLAQPARPDLPRIAVEDDGGGSMAGLLAASLDGVPGALRIASATPIVGAAIETRIATAASRGVPVWLSIPAPAAEDALDAWRTALGGAIDRLGSSMAVLEIAIDGQAPAVAAFAVQVASTEVRARSDRARVAIGGAAMDDDRRRGAIYSADLAPYVDLLVLASARREGADAWLARVDPDARLALVESGTEASSRDPARVLVEALLRDLGTAVVIRAWPAGVLTPDARAALRSASGVLARPFSALDPDAVGLSLQVASPGTTPVPECRLLFDTQSFSTFVACAGVEAPVTLAMTLQLSSEGAPVVVDLLTGARGTAETFARAGDGRRSTLTTTLAGAPVLIDFNDGAAVGAESGVSAERALTVAEIISRHQQRQLVQDRLVRRYIADARVRQYFRPTLTDPGYEVVTENRYFVAGDGIEWEQLSFAVNGSTWRDDPPPYPLLQPEQVLSLPLQLRFDEGYRYRLQGTERLDGFDCYVVRFEPVRVDPTLYGGTVWIDRRTFARVQVRAVQGGLPGMVVSNDETHRYAQVATVGDFPVFLFTGLAGRQTVLIAGRNIQLEKHVEFTGFRVNDGAFLEAREAARRSDRTMFRETPTGLRYYVKEGDRRVVSDRPTSSVKAMALGVIVDSSYGFPLPIFGINYVDFSFGSPDQQLALLFGGVLAAGNIQRPQLGARRLSGSVDFFAIAAPSSDREYEPGGEIEEERVLTWPMSTGVNLGWQATAFQKISVQYQFRFDAYVRDRTTAESFRLPSSTVTNGAGLQWEYSRGGYSVVLNGTWYQRARWRRWGMEGEDGELVPTPAGYAKYMASASRLIFLDAFQTINLNAAWFGGRDLDRFVKYQFGLFDATRVHGVPAAARFGELAVARGSYSINVFDQYRLDLFLDQAWGRDDRGDADWQRIPGIGAAFNVRAPWNTILRADIGRSWLPDRYASLGSTTLQIMLLKPLR